MWIGFDNPAGVLDSSANPPDMLAQVRLARGKNTVFESQTQQRPRGIEPHRRKLHSIQTAAEALDISRDTVRRYLKQGKLESVLLSPRCRRITDESLQKLIDGGAA